MRRASDVLRARTPVGIHPRTVHLRDCYDGVGTKANRDAIGARVYVCVDGRRPSGEIQSGSGFISHNDSRVHFGLADNVSYNRIEVQWPGGGREVFPGGKSNRIVRLVQGSHGGN